MLHHFLRISISLRSLLSRLLLASLLMATTKLSAQTPDKKVDTIGKFSIKGKVLDSSSKAPIQFVNLMLKKLDNQPVLAKVSAVDGSFCLNVPEKGAYLLVVSYMGYRTRISETIQVEAPVNNIGDILLQAQAGMLGAVTIKGKKPLIQNKIDKLVYNASSDIGNKSGSASDVLRKAPMVTVDAEGNVKMRGNSNIKVLLNGRPSNILAKNLKEALKMIPASSISSIEIITTPSAKYEAEGAAGVINIITKKKINGTSGNLDLSGGNLDQSVNGGLGTTVKKFDLNFSLNASSEQKRSLSQVDRTTVINGVSVGRLLQNGDELQKERGLFGDLNAEFRTDSTQTIGAVLSYWKGQWPQTSTLFNSYKSSTDVLEYCQTGHQSGRFRQLDFQLSYEKKFRRSGQELQLIGQAANSADQSDYHTRQVDLTGQPLLQEQSPNKDKGRDFSLQGDYIHPIDKLNKYVLEAGARLSWGNSSSSYNVYNDRGKPGALPLILDPARSDRMKYFQNIVAGYLSLRIDAGKNWSFRPGLRFEQTRLGGEFVAGSPSFSANFSNFLPSFLITKKLNEQYDFKLNYTERIRRPWIWDLNPYTNSSDPLNVTSGNPMLRPELTRMLEAGYNFTAQSGFTLNNSLYFNTNNNAIEQLATVNNSGASFTKPQNIASNKRLGTNVNASFNVNPDWATTLGAEYYYVWFKSSALNVKNHAGFYAFNINSSYSLPAGYIVQVSGDYSNGDITLQGRNSARYNYNMSVRKEFLKRKASLTLTVNNPFQQNFRQTYSAIAPTFQSTRSDRIYNRSIALAFSWQFGGVRREKGPGRDVEERIDKSPVKGRIH